MPSKFHTVIRESRDPRLPGYKEGNPRGSPRKQELVMKTTQYHQDPTFHFSDHQPDSTGWGYGCIMGT